MSEVVSLWGQPTGERNPNPALIDSLEKALERAKAGEIVGAAYAFCYHDGYAGYELAGLVGGYSMLGAIETAKAGLMEINRDG